MRAWSHPRLIIAAALGATTGFLLPHELPAATRVIIGLDVGGVIFLVSSWIMMARATSADLLRRARLQDEQRPVILILTVGAAGFSLAAIFIELHGIKELATSVALWHVALAAGTLVCSWLVTHTLFALHYAHLFYGDARGDAATLEVRGGLAIPGCEQPDYWDFLYFAFVVGMTCQTSDVQVTGHGLRRLCLAHGVLSFFFNTVIQALSINIAASLL